MKLQEIIDVCQNMYPCEIDVRYDEPMSAHTTFKVGGPADCWVQPKGIRVPAFCASLLQCAKETDVPVFILGGGANIVVGDKGIRGIVLDMNAWTGRISDEEQSDTQLVFTAVLP